MSPIRLKQLLQNVQAGDLSIDEAHRELRAMPVSQMEHSSLDTHREIRQGVPEVIYGESKTAQQIADILERILQAHGRALATRVDETKAQAILATLPECNYDPTSRLLQIGEIPEARKTPFALIACAGTSDLPVASEVAGTLEFLGHRAERLTDVGVAGIHRIMSRIDLLQSADVVISVAGMEGALTSVIGGLVSAPVIGVPTSVGYGVSAGGHAALNAMLSSCASGTAVVNIDNGFGAAVFAHTILSKLKEKP